MSGRVVIAVPAWVATALAVVAAGVIGHMIGRRPAPEPQQPAPPRPSTPLPHGRNFTRGAP